MRKSLSFVAAASLAIGGTSLFATADQSSGGQQLPSAQQNQKSGSSQQPQVVREEVLIYGVLVPQNASNVPQGFGRTAIPGMPDIRQTFGQVTLAAYQKGNEAKLLDFLSSKDKQRLQDSFTKADRGRKLDQVLSQLDQTWKQKYNTNFDPNQGALALGSDYTIMEGRANPALLSNWPVQQSTTERDQDRSPRQQKSPPSEPQSSGASSVQQSGNGSGQPNAGQQSADQKQVAVVVLPAEGSMPETHVSLIREGGSWKIEVPDNIDGQKLHDNLVKQVTWLSQHSDQWPKDPKQAYAPATHHLMMALYGQDVQQSSQSSQRSSGQKQ